MTGGRTRESLDVPKRVDATKLSVTRLLPPASFWPAATRVPWSVLRTPNFHFIFASSFIHPPRALSRH